MEAEAAAAVAVSGVDVGADTVRAGVVEIERVVLGVETVVGAEVLDEDRVIDDRLGVVKPPAADEIEIAVEALVTFEGATAGGDKTTAVAVALSEVVLRPMTVNCGLAFPDDPRSTTM